ncbi:chain length determinant family protein [Alginatibacterium sediminis]|uniref:Chain length determinant family protein n=1 Tax=Alginatibacterium sediminis TaxID=2164068 RepID=A0A420E6Y2_9ALTE|nr:XrtA system polysaccharide chain length determinant [Alginatibacterium sediminis]RKF14400.1 chain length determinant family protein [Alginatibacterium sediminis]
MQELIANLQQYLSGVWLKRRYLMIATWLICPLGWVAITLMPNQYTSEARVYADTRSILQPLLKGLAIQNDPGQELVLMVRTLLSRTNLEKIARLSDVDVSVSTEAEYEALLANLKRNISVSSARKQNLYDIVYHSDDPQRAKDVVEAVLNVFVENTLGEKRVETEDANAFIRQQIEEYEKRLIASEKRLADFKRTYSGLLPGSGSNYYSQVESLETQLELTRLELSEAITRLQTARSQLFEEESNVRLRLDSVNTEYDQRIEQLRTRKDDLLIRYTEKHPSVVETTNQINELESLRSRKLSSSNSSDELLSGNPVYQQMRINVGLLTNEVESMKVRESRQNRKLEEARSRLSQVPDVEAQLAGLNRSYGITKQKYEALLVRRESAQISQSAGQNTEEIKFRIIDPPRVPSAPSGPARPLFVIVVLVAGFAVGLGLSLLFSQINPVVHSSLQLYEATGLPVFGVVSATEQSGLEKRTRRKSMIFLSLNLLLLIGFAGFFIVNSNHVYHAQVMNLIESLGVI